MSQSEKAPDTRKTAAGIRMHGERLVKLAWVVGLLEASGSFLSDRGSLRVSITRPDEETVQRLLEYTGIGTVFGPRLRHGYKPQWQWTVSSPKEVELLLSLTTPWFSTRRKQQIERLKETST